MKIFFSVICICFVMMQTQDAMSSESSTVIWESSYAHTAPVIDGKRDRVWDQSKTLTIEVREAMGGDKPFSVELSAIHTDDTLYVLTRWPDSTKSDMRDPYVWNDEAKGYERPSKPDDQFSLEFPLSGNFDLRMITLVNRYTTDVWHWKAGRGNPVGWVDDKRHIIDQQPVPGAVEYSMGGHGSIYIARLMDDGVSSYFLKDRPSAFEGNIVDSFEQRQPAGSLADVRGKGVHDGKTWTLEMSRKFNTGHEDDTAIDPTTNIICAIAVLNDELYWDHSVSSLITLRFVKFDTFEIQGMD
ncbi:MAG: ethylbenzene dehydrogenase-related protein [Candidatus Brocadiaceae bacterium]|nr:ethylbenzene dehydrogenase-related protein [Candidatus Brocadiaceae bacterium]